MMTVLKRTIPKWELSGQGEGGHHADEDDDDNPLKNRRDEVDKILCNYDLSSSSSSESEHDEEVEPVKQKEKLPFGVLSGRHRDALDLVTNFFDNSNSYIIYLWYMIDKHQLIKSSMNMLAEGVGARSGAKGIPTAISAKSREESSVTSSLKSVKLPCTPGVEEILAQRITEHAEMV
jgi:hypothetical protein